MEKINRELGRTHIKDYDKALEVEKYKKMILGSVYVANQKIDKTAEILAEKFLSEK